MDETQILRQVKAAIQEGDKATAQRLLLQAIKANPRSETAWLWLSAIVGDPAKERDCLKRVLAINPNNNVAQQHLLKLQTSLSAEPPPVQSSTLTATPESQKVTKERPVKDAKTYRVGRYAAQNLLPGENIVHTTTLTPLIFLRPVLALLAGCIVIAFMSTAEATNEYTGCYGCLGLVVLAVMGDLISTGIRFVTSEFVITDRRVLIKAGFIKRSSLELLLSKVEAVTVGQSMMGRIANFGTVVIGGTGGTKTPFKNIARPLEFRNAVNRQIESRTLEH